MGMRVRGLAKVGKRVLVGMLALCMSLMMVPATAFAVQGVGDDTAAVDEKEAKYFDPENPERADDEVFAFNVVASEANQSPSETRASVEAGEESGGVQARADKANWSATATVSGDVDAGKTGVSVYARRGDATVKAGDVTAETAGQFGAVVSGWYEAGAATATLGDVVAGAGIRVDANRGGTASLEAGNVEATKGDADNFNANSISTSGGGQANVKLGNVSSASSGLVISARGDASKTMVEAYFVIADEGGLLVTNSGGTISAKVMGVDAKGNALSIRNQGGQSTVVVGGCASSSEENGLVYVKPGGGEGADKVLVTDTIEGATNGVVIYPSTANLDLTTWQIKAGSGDIIKGDDEAGTFAKTVSYIVMVEQQEGATLTARKADGTALDKKYADNGQGGYEVAREGDKVILKVDVQEGYDLKGAYNGKGEMVPLLKDDNGDYYTIVPRGGGVYLCVVLEGGEGEEITVVPDPITLVSGASVGGGSDEPAPASDQYGPLLTYKGVEINEVKLEMDGQTPMLRTVLTNTNDNDVEFDCEKFKVLNVDDDSEIAFDTEAKQLKANEADVKCEFKADEGAMQSGDRAYVFYAGQLLGTFTVE